MLHGGLFGQGMLSALLGVACIALWVSIIITPFSGSSFSGIGMTYLAGFATAYLGVAVINAGIGIWVDVAFLSSGEKRDDDRKNYRFRYIAGNAFHVMSALTLTTIFWLAYIDGGKENFSPLNPSSASDPAKTRLISVAACAAGLVLTTFGTGISILSAVDYFVGIPDKVWKDWTHRARGRITAYLRGKTSQTSDSARQFLMNPMQPNGFRQRARM